MNRSELFAAGIAQIPEQIIDLIARGAVFVINHSGGKDSQVMYLMLRDLVPAAQRIIVHADLGEVEWPGAVDHITATTDGEPLHVCRSRRGLLQMIEERGMFPSPSMRQCTSDLKRGPIERTIRSILAENPQFGGHVVNCMGMRAEESPGRRKLAPFKCWPYENAKGKPTGKSIRPRGASPGREWYDWLPIHDLTTAEVFARIEAAGQAPHWVYAAGMSRFSCCFCIMSNKSDLTTAARLNPDLYRRYVELERSTGQVMMMPSKAKGPLTLEQITGVASDVVHNQVRM